jgi:hypothetical protein
VVGFHQIDGGNLLGANGTTIRFRVMMAIGLAASIWFDRPARRDHEG